MVSKLGWVANERPRWDRLEGGSWRVQFEPLGFTFEGETRGEAAAALQAAVAAALNAMSEEDRLGWVQRNMSQQILRADEVCYVHQADVDNDGGDPPLRLV